MKLLKFIVIVVFLFIIGIIMAYSARLPIIGGDDNNWGTILNQYLNVSHTENGTLKANMSIVFNYTNITNDLTVLGNTSLKNVTANYYFGDGSQLTSLTHSLQDAYDDDSGVRKINVNNNYLEFIAHRDDLDKNVTLRIAGEPDRTPFVGVDLYGIDTDFIISYKGTTILAIGNLTAIGDIGIQTIGFWPIIGETYDIGAMAGKGSDSRYRDLYLSGNLSNGSIGLSVANAKTAYDFSQRTDFWNWANNASKVLDNGTILRAGNLTDDVQARVSGTCTNQVMVGINADGTVTCENDDTGGGGVSSWLVSDTYISPNETSTSGINNINASNYFINGTVLNIYLANLGFNQSISLDNYAFSKDIPIITLGNISNDTIGQQELIDFNNSLPYTTFNLGNVSNDTVGYSELFTFMTNNITNLNNTLNTYGWIINESDVKFGFINITSNLTVKGNITFSNLSSCNLETDASGLVICAVDDTSTTDTDSLAIVNVSMLNNVSIIRSHNTTWIDTFVQSMSWFDSFFQITNSTTNFLSQLSLNITRGDLITPDNITWISSQTVGGEVSGTIGSITLSDTALDDQYCQIDDWTSINNYPSACTTNNFVQGVGDTLTCLRPTFWELTNFTSAYDSRTDRFQLTNFSNIPVFLINGNLSILGNVSISGNFSVDTNTLFIDSTNNKVGIGITTPEANLHIYAGSEGGGTPHPDSKIIIEDDDDAILEFRTPTNKENWIYFSDSGDQSGGIGYYHTGDYIMFRTGGANRNVVIDSSGRVGIGTSTPSQLLQVFASGVNSRIDANRSSGSVVGLEAGLAKGYIGTQTGHPLGFLVNASTKMTIDTSGKVGIGATNPAHTLTVAGNVNISTTLNVSQNTEIGGNLTMSNSFFWYNGSCMIINGSTSSFAVC